ncbi:hypothetical protein C8Q80DRAFT_1138831 [Daedaleopsis nitida]|nr:hypothetical protein C8Q80DRAFT_1138831 [Daedaleopsis nitida]
MLSTLIATFVYNLVQASFSQGQTTKVVCRKGYEWMSNSLQQNPCWVTAWLWVPCYGTGNNSEVDALKPGWFYDGPEDKDPFESTPCDCNTVLYSTYAACAICQGAEIDPWPIYRTNCTQIYNGSYPEPVPGGTAIPAWAFLDVIQNSTFNVDAAQALAAQNVPDFMGNKTSVPLSANTSALASSITAANTDPSSSPSAGSAPVGATLETHGSDVGAVAGAAVGGTIGVLLTAALIIFVIVRHRRRTNRSRSDSSSCSDTTVASTENVFSPTSTKSAKSNMLYNVNDPRTFPPPLTYGSPLTPSVSSGAATIAQPHAVPSPGVGGVVSFYRGFPQV